MKVVVVAGGGRKGGNSAALAHKALSDLNRFGISDLSSEVLELAHFKVLPCSECAYECFLAQCPLRDDARTLIHAMYQADVTILIVPTYGGLPPAAWVALMQRRQNEMTRVSPPKQFVAGIVLANEAGSDIGEFTPDIVRSTVEHWGADCTYFTQIRPLDYQRSPLTVGLADHPQVEAELEALATRVWDWFRGARLQTYKGAM